MRLLVLSYFVDEPGVAPSNHIDDRLQELSARGISIGVVGGARRARGSVMHAPNVRLHGVSDWRLQPFVRRTIAARLPSCIRTRARAVADAVGRFGADRFADWTWAAAAARYVRKAIPADTYDLIYSTGGPAAAHLAASTLAAQSNRRWIAELQDPLVFEGLSTEFKASPNDVTYLAKAEDALRTADAVVCLTEACAHHYRARLGTNDVYCIYPGSAISRCSVSPPTSPRPARARRRFLHAGSLLGARSIETFLDAVYQLDMQDRIELVLAGDIDIATSRLVRKHASFVRHIGRISRLETAAQIRAADVCLVVQHAGAISALTIPSKFYEYAALGARVLFLGYRNAEVEALCRKCNACFADQAAPSAIMDALRVLVDSRDAGPHARPVHIGDATEQFLGLCTRVLHN